MDNEQRNSGIMEDWNDGILDKNKKQKLFNPLFHYSIVPMGLVHRASFNVHRSNEGRVRK